MSASESRAEDHGRQRTTFTLNLTLPHDTVESFTMNLNLAFTSSADHITSVIATGTARVNDSEREQPVGILDNCRTPPTPKKTSVEDSETEDETEDESRDKRSGFQGLAAAGVEPVRPSACAAPKNAVDESETEDETEDEANSKPSALRQIASSRPLGHQDSGINETVEDSEEDKDVLVPQSPEQYTRQDFKDQYTTGNSKTFKRKADEELGSSRASKRVLKDM